jgi:hypothetical protein
MPRDGSMIPSDVLADAVDLCEPCGRRGSYNVMRRTSSTQRLA